MCARVSVCVSVSVYNVCCYSADFLSLLVLVYAADFPGIAKSARRRVTPLANSSLSSRRPDAPLAPSSSTAPLLARYYRPDALRQVRDVLVAALGAQLLQRLVQGQQVVPVQPARPLGAVDVLGQGLGVLGPDELVVVWGSDVCDASTVCRRAHGDDGIRRTTQRCDTKSGGGLYVQTSVRMGFSGSEAGEKGV